jgi:signal transduction histidine kinase
MTTQTQDVHEDPVAAQRLILDQREVNERMVAVAIGAQELAELAEAAQARAEATTNELRESEDRYRTLFELSPVAVYSCDHAGVIQRFNKHAAALWGRRPEPGDTDERFCGSFKMFRPDGSFMPHDQCPMAEVVDGKLSEVVDAEVLIERPDGSRITVVVNIRALKNQRGEVTGATNCFYDITERKRAETQVADSLSRERELAEFRELFIGILGHDLRNPLTAIVMSAAGLLRHDELDQKDAEKAATIIRGGQRMQRMIDQLLDFTRARLGGGFPVEAKPADLREVCRNVVDEFEAGIELEAEGDLTGTWDPDRLAQALSNIAGNALEHAAPGTPVVVKARAEGLEVVVEVSNEGEPIPADVLPFIFEPFRRARPGRSTAGNLGLGLYIAKQIVSSGSGSLVAYSTDGKTTFSMRLPRQAPSSPPPSLKAERRD